MLDGCWLSVRVKGLSTSKWGLPHCRLQPWLPQGPEGHAASSGADENRETTYCSAAPSEIHVLHFGVVACQLAADEPKADMEKQNYPEIDILFKKKKKKSLQHGCKGKKKVSAFMYQKLRLPLQFKKAGDRQTLSLPNHIKKTVYPFYGREISVSQILLEMIGYVYLEHTETIRARR